MTRSRSRSTAAAPGARLGAFASAIASPPARTSPMSAGACRPTAPPTAAATSPTAGSCASYSQQGQGVSISRLTAWTKLAASQPSTTR